MNKRYLILKMFFFMMYALPFALAVDSKVSHENISNNQPMSFPSPQVILHELFKQNSNDDALVLKNKSEARFWFGYPFSVENVDYYVGFVSIHKFDFNLNAPAIGVMDQAGIAQVTFRKDLGKWKVISKNNELKSYFGSRGEAPYLNDKKAVKTFFYKDKMLLSLPTSMLAEQGTYIELLDVFSFDLNNKQWSYLGGDIKTAQDNGAGCAIATESKNSLCMRYTSVVTYLSQLENGYPLIAVKRKGTDFCEDYTKICPVNDVKKYAYQIGDLGYGKYTLLGQ